MKIVFEPKTFDGYNRWYTACLGVIFVKNEEDRLKLFNFLCKQHSAWKKSEDVIQIIPNVPLKDEKDLHNYCKWVHEDCEIDNVKAAKKVAQFLMFGI